MLDNHGDLAVAVLIFYILFIGPAIYVCIRHGVGRHLGWLYLVTLPIVRIVGAACQIAAEQNPSVGLYTAASICNGIGLFPLLMTLMGFMNRVNDGMPTRLAAMYFRLTHIILLAALALSIVGGVESIPTNKPDEISKGHSLRKVSSVLFLIAFLANLGFTVIGFLRISKAWEGDRKIIYAAVVAMPFLFVRVLYSLFISFDTSSSFFNASQPNIYVQAFMQITMEFIVFGIYLSAGLVSPSTKHKANEHVESQSLLGKLMGRGSGGHHKVEGRNDSVDDAELGNIPAQRAS